MPADATAARKSLSGFGPKSPEPPANEAQPPTERTVPSTCIEHQAGRPTLRLSFQIKVF